MSTPEQHIEVVVGDDGSVSVHLSAQDVTRLGAHPGDRLAPAAHRHAPPVESAGRSAAC